MASGGFIDVTVSLHGDLARWPGDPPIELERVTDLERGDDSTFSTVRMGLHSGTHMDAPLHFVRGGKTIAELPVEIMVGRCRVIETAESVLSAEAVGTMAVERGEKILFKTRNSALWREGGRFREDFVHLSTAGAHALAERRPALVGIDYLSVSGYRSNEVEVHRALLEAGIWIVESLDLSKVQAGHHELLCLPLKIDNAEGAPARVLLRRL